MTLRTLRGALGALFLLTACGGSASVDSSESTTPTTGPVAIASEGEIAIPEEARLPPMEVTLIDAGEGDPQLLRIRSEVGQTQRMRLKQVMTMGMRLGERQLPTVEMPPILMDFAIVTTDVGEDGAMRHELSMEGIQVLGEGPMVGRLEQELAPLRDLRGWDVVDPRGRILATQYEIPQNASPQLRRSLEQMQDALRQLMPPLPEAPVAVGAKWQAESQVRSGIAFRQIATYTLEEREDDRIVLSVTTEQHAEPQPMESDQPGVTARLLAFEGEATARLQMSLDGLVPESQGRAAVTLTTEATAEGRAPQRVTMEMGTAVEASPLR